MDKSERQRLKQLANDAIVDLFGVESREARLAEALEKCVNEIEEANEVCPTCSICENHGDIEDDSIDVDVNEIIRIHGELKKSAAKLQSVYGTEDTEELESLVNELEAEVLP